MVQQWCIRVGRRQGEQRRRALLEQGVLDLTLKPRKDGESILFPVLAMLEGCTREEFEAHPVIKDLPRHELIGGIAIMQDREPGEAERLLVSRPSIHTVLFPESDVEGDFRTRRFEVLAGQPTTRTRYIEHGHRFDIDLSVAYFSGRLSTERQRILSSMETGECVLDMFAGVGPYAITLAGKARIVVASDLNPGAVQFLVRNLSLNRTRNVLAVLADASHLTRVLPQRFNRVIMNLPLGAVRFLPCAVNLCLPGGVIHCYALQEKEGEFLPEIEQYPVSDVCERYVRSYSPGRWHAVYDITRE